MTLVRWGPYAVSMVGVAGFGIDNTAPPHTTLLLLGTAQAGGVLLLQPVLSRTCSHPVVWAVVVAVETRAMTVYLWHMTAPGLLAGLSLSWAGLGLGWRPATSAWWWSRPGWCLALAVTTLGLVTLTGRWESPPPPAGTAPVSPVLPWSAIVVVSTCLGLLVVRVPMPVPWHSAILLLAPVLVHAALGRAARPAGVGFGGRARGSAVTDVRDPRPWAGRRKRSMLGP